MKPVMLKRRCSWTHIGVLGFASLHCGTPSAANPTGDAPVATSEPRAPADLAPTVPASLAPSGPANGGTSLPEVGGQTGDDSGQTGLACDVVTETSLALDDTSRFGFSANDRLALVLGTHEMPLRWLRRVYDATDATSSLRVEVELLSHEARLLERHDSLYDMDCGPRLLAEARLKLSSADGALAETVDATLELGSDIDIVGLSASVPAAALRGSHVFDPPQLDGHVPSALSVSARFTRYGQSGEIVQLYGEGNAVWRAGAEWPDWQACSSGGRVPANYPEQRPSVTDALADVRLHTPVTILGPDSERTPAQLDIEAVPNSGCHDPRASGNPTQSAESLIVQTQVTLTSDALPGPVHVPLDFVSSFTSNPDERHARFSSLGTPCGIIGHYSPQDFITHCGDWGVDLSGVESPFLGVESSITPASGYVLFQIRGKRSPGCTPGGQDSACPADTPSSNDVVELGSVRVLLGTP